MCFLICPSKEEFWKLGGGARNVFSAEKGKPA